MWYILSERNLVVDFLPYEYHSVIHDTSTGCQHVEQCVLPGRFYLYGHGDALNITFWRVLLSV